MSEPQSTAAPRLRTVRSFVRREGRITAAQQRALEELLPARRWPMKGETPFEITGRRAPLALEIGTGDGENVAALAARHPEMDFIACEVHAPGVGHLLLRAEALGLTNLWVAQRDVNELLATLPAESLSAVYMFFPDPWPKTRHHKRRLFQSALLTALARVLARHGRYFLATDSDDYAEWVLTQLLEAPDWLNLAGEGRYAPRLSARLLTKFERRAQREGRRIFDVMLARR